MSPSQFGYTAPQQEEEWVTAPKKLTKKQAATHAVTDEVRSYKLVTRELRVSYASVTRQLHVSYTLVTR